MLKTIVYIYDQAFLSGGAAKIAIGEAVEMSRKGYNVIYFTAVGPICEELLNSKVNVICLNEEHIAFTKNPKSLLRGIWNRRASAILEDVLMTLDRNDTVVHIHGWTKALSSSVIATAYKCHFKTIITLHEYFCVCQNGGLYNYTKNHICEIEPGTLKCYLCNCDKRNYIQKWYRNVRQLIQEIILKRARPNVIYITKFSSERLKLNKNKIKNAYALTNFVEIQLRERICVENNDKFLFIGRISEEKGIDIFCKAVESAKVQGVVIGEGPLKKQYEQLYPDISFVGWKEHKDIVEYLKRARALVISSKWYETMGLTVIEMQQYGIPCIVPEECAASEYIRNQVDGLLYKIGNIDSLVQCIYKLQEREYIKRLSENFIQNIDLKQYSIEKHLNKLVDIYMDTLCRDI